MMYLRLGLTSKQHRIVKQQSLVRPLLISVKCSCDNPDITWWRKMPFWAEVDGWRRNGRCPECKNVFSSLSLPIGISPLSDTEAHDTRFQQQ